MRAIALRVSMLTFALGSKASVQYNDDTRLGEGIPPKFVFEPSLLRREAQSLEELGGKPAKEAEEEEPEPASGEKKNEDEVKKKEDKKAKKEMEEAHRRYDAEKLASEAMSISNAKFAKDDAEQKEKSAEVSKQRSADLREHYERASAEGAYLNDPEEQEERLQELREAEADAESKDKAAQASKEWADQLGDAANRAKGDGSGKDESAATGIGGKHEEGHEKDEQGHKKNSKGKEPSDTKKEEKGAGNTYSICAKYGEECTCKDGVLMYGGGFDWVSIRLDNTVTCDTASIKNAFTGLSEDELPEDFREPTKGQIECQCYNMEWCKAMAHSPQLRAAGLPIDATVDSPSVQSNVKETMGTNSYQRRRFCGWGPVDCVWAPWSTWTECHCGSKRQRTREKAREARHDGKACGEDKEEVEDCPCSTTHKPAKEATTTTTKTTTTTAKEK